MAMAVKATQKKFFRIIFSPLLLVHCFVSFPQLGGKS